jgi:hypothetical protein
MIPARSLQFELGQDGHHHVRMEVVGLDIQAILEASNNQKFVP